MNRKRLTGKLAIMALAPMLMLGSATLSGCAANPDNDSASPTPFTATPGHQPTPTSTGVPNEEPAPSSTPIPIVFEIDGREVAGQLDDSPTATSLAAQLPLTLTFADHGGQEKYAELPEALDLTGAPPSSDAQPLQIGYYVPDQRLILYYESAEAVRSQTGQFTVTIRAAG